MFAISLLVFALQWNTGTALAPGFALRPSTPSPYIQQLQQCLDSTWQAKASYCPMLPAVFRPECFASARESCLLS
jgi:hypothetical protein